MSDKMHPIAFEKMLEWIFKELEEQKTIFGVHQQKFYRNKNQTSIRLFNEKLGTIIGPAAGPHSQLAQNIVVSYLMGARFIELKTVQIIDGEDLPVSKPCILAQDECYNVEWSTELRVEDAFDEYIKAWILCHVLMVELGLSSERDFIFNMSVGYDLKGIQSPKIESYIEGMKNAEHTDTFKLCIASLKEHLHLFHHFKEEHIMQISPRICQSITLSTLHGCPPEEIEKIANYLLKEKQLHTLIKMNPTLLGEEFVRDTLNHMNYEYIEMNSHHFQNDLQYEDAIHMLKRLKAHAKQLQLELGVKLTNTLPVKILNQELPGEEMYMSGVALYPLTINLSYQLASEFNGDLLISYSGGVDAFNIEQIARTGIKPITFATTLLKPGGYERIHQMAQRLELMLNGHFLIDVGALQTLAHRALTDDHHKKQKHPQFKTQSTMPLFNCTIAPCMTTCPIHQKIPQYLSLVASKRYEEAFKLIVKDNTAPFITGTICDHQCQGTCRRNGYESQILIRNMKKIACIHAMDTYLEEVNPTLVKTEKKAVVIGGGPAGIASALFLRRNGMEVTVLEKRDKPYGMVEYVIPSFRIDEDAIKKDFELAKKVGVKFCFGVEEVFNIKALRKDYDYVILATGAWKEGNNPLGTKEQVYPSISFLELFKKTNGQIELGKDVCIIGGGDVAMDCARAALRVPGVERVKIIYRRTKAYMPASYEEIHETLSEGVELVELLSPIEFKDGVLHCEKIALGEYDEHFRRQPVKIGEHTTVSADAVIIATGEHIESDLLVRNGIELNQQGYPNINDDNETNISHVYVAGDLTRGPKTVVLAIADGKKVARAILSHVGIKADFDDENLITERIGSEKKGVLSELSFDEKEGKRCLSCHEICETCVDVCPNRANVVIKTKDHFKAPQIIHLDGMCNECGNCEVFCPHQGKPYSDKVTVFWNEEDLCDSQNIGFYIDLNKGHVTVRCEDGEVLKLVVSETSQLSKEMETIILTCIESYRYII